PQAASQTGNNNAPTRAPHLPTLALSVAQEQSAAAVDNLFSPAPAPVAAAAPIVHAPRPGWSNAGPIVTGSPARFDDSMVNTGQPSEVVALPNQEAPVRRRKLLYAGWALIAALVVAGGVFAGLWIREGRLRKQVSQAITKAGTLAKDDSWRGHLAARDVLAGVVKASNTASTRSKLLLARAIMAYEFGEDRAAMIAAIAAPTDSSDAATAAAGYMALLNADSDKARAIGKQLTSVKGFEAMGHYIDGRGALLMGDHLAAAEALRLAVEREPRPLYQLALAEAKIAGGAINDADKLITATPEGTVLRAMGDLRADRIGSHLGLAAQLDAITITAEKAANDPARIASQLTIALALAVVAETQARTGEMDRAQSTFGRAVAVGVDDYRFADQTVRALIAMRRLEDARKAAERALQTWPNYRPMSIALADIELRNGDAQAAFTRLKDPRFGAFVDGATIRGRAALLLGNLTAAQDDLDAVLKVAPQAAAAVVARAYLDVLRGDGKAAMERLGKVGPDASPAIITVYGAAQRLVGQPEALAQLRKAATAAAHDYSGVAHLELARGLRDSGDLTSARTEFAAALALGQQRARLEQAVVDVEDRHLPQGRTELEAMYKAGFAGAASNGNVDGMLLLELIRARSLSGDIEGAEALLKIADRRTDLPKWQVLRERGRLALKRNDTPNASSTLLKAMADKAADAETFLLVANVVEGNRDLVDLAAQLKAAAPRLAGTGELEIINGKLEFAAEHFGPAEVAFTKAKELLSASHATPRRLAMAHVGLAVSALARNDEGRARSEIAQAMELDPSSADAKINGSFLAATPALRLDLLVQAVKLAPFHTVAWMWLGQAALAVDNKAEYDRAVARLTEIAPDSQELVELRGAAKPAK
ncbi:MAG TPA: hypothetical protein PLF40_20420, partial [Kofleriaceae bacterium]|nr:hypothetical protein [Kofleriaceae bacterium]